MNNYEAFLANKTKDKHSHGFKPLWLSPALFDFQKVLVEWTIEKGRAAIFAECGLGKSLCELVWAENIIRKTKGNVLLLTPLAVGPQMVREADKFGLKAKRARQGEVFKGITVTNYQQLFKYRSSDFVAVVADESSCLKGTDSKTRHTVTKFLSSVPYRLLCTATPAPNDFMELGTSSEALGVMSRNSMLGMYFTNDGESTQQWRLKGHAKTRFWQWMASWSRAVRKPSDLGFKNDKFNLPPLKMIMHTIKSRREGLFPRIANTLNEQRQEKRETLESRCSKAAEVLPKNKTCIAWCQLNSEGDLLTNLIPGAVQVSGSDSDDEKEEKLDAFSRGQIRCLVSKASICGFGLNWQHCADVVFFVDHSHEKFYQAIRRCWRFGQEKEVSCNIVYSEAEQPVLRNMLEKERKSVELYDGIIRSMNSVLNPSKNGHPSGEEMVLPSWLKSNSK